MARREPIQPINERRGRRPRTPSSKELATRIACKKGSLLRRCFVARSCSYIILYTRLHVVGGEAEFQEANQAVQSTEGK